ncbi:MAG: 5-dehydro-2-deoxygluconokinase [Planctomycetes bacterium]|nr:5-dehydro-2-deoxygluconokinase [Planctomycetota bacterium]
MSAKSYDVLTMGRSSIDLYSNDVGVPFPEITGFAAYVGGCPTNISVGTRRLGLRSALLTAVGEDPVGDFVLHFLRREGVETGFIPRKPGHRTSAVVLGIEPPDRFPLVFYRDNCADMEIDIEDMLRAPVTDCGVLVITGTGLSREPSRSATLAAAERARAAGVTVVLDIDFRPDQWADARAFGATVRSVLRLIDIVIGTEDEINAASLTEAKRVTLTHSQVSDARVAGDADTAAQAILGLGPRALLQKRGAEGARIHLGADDGWPPPVDVRGYPVEVANILGAGDAFASGFLFGYVRGWDWYRAARFGNVCGAIVVTRHGCANFMPTYDEAMAFSEQHGGF